MPTRQHPLTPSQVRLLRILVNGGRFHAALREPDDFVRDGVVFSESVGIFVHPSNDPATWYRIRNQTAGPLYLNNPALVNCHPESSGHREFRITEDGRKVVEGL